MKKQSFKYSLLGFIGLMIVLMIFISSFSMIVIRSVESQYTNMIEKMLAINEIGTDINNSVFYFDKYFTTKSIVDMNSYDQYYYDALVKLKTLNVYLNEETDVNYTDLNNLIQNYHNNGQIAIYKFMITGRNEDCYQYFTETKQIASYSGEYVKRLNDSYLKYNDIEYRKLKSKTTNGRVIITIFLGFTILFCIVFSAFFSRMVTVPIEELAQSAEEISRGNFDIKKMKPAGMHEIDMLQTGFNKMVWEIRILIEKIKEKATIEKKLNEQELKNLLVENMLKESQLKALQSQINPHFLFNTLNAIAQTAIIEEAGETEELINAVSELLRYSLSTVDIQSTVFAEISVIKQYIFIQETRFKDRIKFNIAVDESLSDVQIPGMILQPLVENAFVHGIEGREEGGKINISVYKRDDYCILMIEDNGSGITKEKLGEILSDEVTRIRGASTGIGVKNVINRLKIMYQNKDVFTIESELNKGTRIYIKIPISRGSQNV